MPATHGMSAFVDGHDRSFGEGLAIDRLTIINNQIDSENDLAITRSNRKRERSPRIYRCVSTEKGIGLTILNQVKNSGNDYWSGSSIIQIDEDDACGKFFWPTTWISKVLRPGNGAYFHPPESSQIRLRSDRLRWI
jgi:hypothetical protein